MLEQRWLIYAILSAVAAALVPIFAKKGMESVDSTLATAVRSMVMTLFLIGACTVMRVWSHLGSIGARPLRMILYSGIAGAVSWLFYFKAVQVGDVSQVAPVDKMSMPIAVVLAMLLFPNDRPTAVNWVGVGLIAAGGYLAAMPRVG